MLVVVLVVLVVVVLLSLPCRAALPPAVPMVQVHACQLLGVVVMVVVMVVVWSVVCIEVYVLGWSVVCPCTLLYTVERHSSPPAGRTTGGTR